MFSLKYFVGDFLGKNIVNFFYCATGPSSDLIHVFQILIRHQKLICICVKKIIKIKKSDYSANLNSYVL